MRSHTHSSFCLLIILTMTAALLSFGCAAQVDRNPIPETYKAAAKIPGIKSARVWGDQYPGFSNTEFQVSAEDFKIIHAQLAGNHCHILALSGGGANGAFGAGFLTGWTEKKTRPEFYVVTGVSAGALIAPFAYLGKDFDPYLKDIWTGYGTKDILKKRGFFSFITGDAFSESVPLRNLVAQYLTPDLIEKIGTEYREKRRMLFIGTSNLDAMRPVIWNIGKIAASDHPEKVDLIHDILVASASIPGLFPPVYIQVESQGGSYDEIHVDGGITSQVFVYPPGIDWKRGKTTLDILGKPRLYIIWNAKLIPEWNAVKPKLGEIVGRSVRSLVRTQGLGDLYRIYLNAVEDHMDYNLVYIGDDFTEQPDEKEIFDQVYMTDLFHYGHNKCKTPDYVLWQKRPPIMLEPAGQTN